MPQPNLKVYLAVSGLLIVLFLIVTFVPFSKKAVEKKNTYVPAPTLVEVNHLNNSTTEVGAPYADAVEFTGVKETELPQQVLDKSIQKQDLRSKTPFDTGLFKIEFNYSEDKFAVTLNEPNQENLKQFEDWKKNNYPAIPINQFIFN